MIGTEPEKAFRVSGAIEWFEVPEADEIEIELRMVPLLAITDCAGRRFHFSLLIFNGH